MLLSDAPRELLSRYPVVVAPTALLSGRAEAADKLTAYVEHGGTLVVSAATLASFGGRGLLGVNIAEQLSATACDSLKSRYFAG